MAQRSEGREWNGAVRYLLFQIRPIRLPTRLVLKRPESETVPTGEHKCSSQRHRDRANTAKFTSTRSIRVQSHRSNPSLHPLPPTSKLHLQMVYLLLVSPPLHSKTPHPTHPIFSPCHGATKLVRMAFTVAAPQTSPVTPYCHRVLPRSDSEESNRSRKVDGQVRFLFYEIFP